MLEKQYSVQIYLYQPDYIYLVEKLYLEVFKNALIKNFVCKLGLSQLRGIHVLQIRLLNIPYFLLIYDFVHFLKI